MAVTSDPKSFQTGASRHVLLPAAAIRLHGGRSAHGRQGGQAVKVLERNNFVRGDHGKIDETCRNFMIYKKFIPARKKV